MLDLNMIFNVIDSALQVNVKVDLSDEKISNKSIFPDPLRLSVLVENVSDVVYLKYNVEGVLKTDCDRCLCEVIRDIDDDYSHILTTDDDYAKKNEGAIIFCENGKLDLTQVLISDVFLNLDLQILCDEGCKGLCSICGQNLNLEECDCEIKIVDPRLEKLKDLLK